MTDTLHDDADDLLHWLNAHSVSISDGIPFSLMQQKWAATQRSEVQLRRSLEWLFAERLLVMTPGLEQPHVRLSTKGFEQLLSAMDQARRRELPPPAAKPEALAPPVLPSAAPPAFKPSPLAPAAVAAVASVAPSIPEKTEADAPVTRFVDPAKPPTEIGLRNQVLTIFRDLKLAAGQQLIAMTLTRYWQETGQRGEHLRAGIDVILRDGYVKPAYLRYENYWMLTPEGAAFIKAPISHAALLALAQPLRQIEASYPDEDLRRKGLGLFKKHRLLPFNALESEWRHSRDALIHALDLLIKCGDVELSPEQPLAFQLTMRALAKRR